MATTIIEIKRATTTTTNIATSIKTIASFIKTITATTTIATSKTTAATSIATIKTKASTTIETIATTKILKTKSNNNYNNSNSNQNNSNNNNSFDKVLFCTFPRCNRVAASKAGLANHVRQKHQTQASIKCQYCGLNFKPQGIYNHKKNAHLSILCTYLMVDERKNSVCVCVCLGIWVFGRSQTYAFKSKQLSNLILEGDYKHIYLKQL